MQNVIIYQKRKVLLKHFLEFFFLHNKSCSTVQQTKGLFYFSIQYLYPFKTRLCFYTDEFEDKFYKIFASGDLTEKVDRQANVELNKPTLRLLHFWKSMSNLTNKHLNILPSDLHIHT